MALARKCSRCNAFYEDYYGRGKDNAFNALQKLDRDLDNKHYCMSTLDLCPACKESFVCWLDDTAVTDHA